MAPGEGCVFVCEGSDAWDDAQRLTAFLEGRGIPVWLGWRDKGEISHPADYFDARANAADRCAAFLLLLSADPADARDLRDLAGFAHARGKPIFPVLVSERAPLADFAVVMGERPWTSTFGSGAEQRLERLAADLRAVLDGDPAALPQIARITPAAAGASLVAPQMAMPARATDDPADRAVPPAAAPAPADEAEIAEIDAPPFMTETAGTEHERMLRAFVGPRADRYLDRWARGGTFGWNWAAFLFPSLWLMLRKMWLSALVVALAQLALYAAALIFPALILFEIGGLAVLSIVTALVGDRLYRARGERALARVERCDLGPHARLARLQAKGGRSWIAVILLVVVWEWAAAMVYLHADPDNSLCLGDTCLQARDMPWRVPLAGVGGASAGAATATDPALEPGVTTDWLVGRWGVAGTGCRTWIAFDADGSLSDNAGGTGRWSLERGGDGGATIILVPERTGEAVPTRVERRGETMLLGAQGAAWSRADC